MQRTVLLWLGFVCTLLTTSAASVLRGDDLPAAEKTKIEALIAHIEGLKDAKFVRNDKEYDAASAAKFLRGKWSAHAASVKSAADFITKLASVSSTTGKPYLIRFKDGKEIKSGEYLRAELARIDK
jgi:hypothetical protein